MPAHALERWQSLTAHRLAVLHRALDHAAPEQLADADARDQAAQAFVIMLAAHFQGFCRDLHNECAAEISRYAQSHLPHVAPFVQSRFSEGRKLNQGAANSSTIGSDFGRFTVSFWTLSAVQDPAAAEARRDLDELAELRNALAHQDFGRTPDKQPPRFGAEDIRRWWLACDVLASAMDAAMVEVLVPFEGGASAPTRSK